jgi:uncharacterized protein with HEPN domain
MSVIQSLESFEKNEVVVDAVLFNLEQIGEIAKSISETTKNDFPDIPWTDGIGLRNIISHNYQGVRLDLIYNIVNTDLGELIHLLKQKQQQ